MPIGYGPSKRWGRGAPSGSSLPTWLASAAVHEWVEIADTKLTADGSQNARLSYSGIATDGGTQIIVAAIGGHGDTHHNGVNSCDLADDAPGWVLRRASSWNGSEANVATYASGEPASRHGYEHAIYSTTHARLILHGTRVTWSTGDTFANVRGLNPATWEWDAVGTFATPASLRAGRCRDGNDNVWAHGDSKVDVYKWTAATDSWAQTGHFSNEFTPPIAADTSRSLLFQLSCGNGQGSGTATNAYKYTSEGTIQTAVTLNSIGGALAQFEADAVASATDAASATDYGSILASMIYDPDGDRFLWWQGLFGRLYYITPNSGTTWDIGIVTTTGSTPTVRAGSFARIAYIAPLKLLVVMPWGSINLFALRLA